MTAGPVDLPAGCSHGLRGRVLGSTVPMMKTAADHRPVVWRETGRPRWSRAVAGCGRRGSAAASMVSGPRFVGFWLLLVHRQRPCSSKAVLFKKKKKRGRPDSQTGPTDAPCSCRKPNPIPVP